MRRSAAGIAGPGPGTTGKSRTVTTASADLASIVRHRRARGAMNRRRPDAESIFYAALGQIPGRPQAGVPSDEACGGGPRLRAPWRACSRRPRRTCGFLDRRPSAPGLVPPRRPPTQPSRGPRHGHRPVQAAGADRRGGMGVGLHGRADRARPRARWRLKVIKPGMDTRAGASPGSRPSGRRLALMDHPNIAKVLDAGRRPSRAGPTSSWSWSGACPITEYCDRATPDAAASGWSCSCRSAGRCSTPTRRASSTATSSRRTSW